MAGSPFEIRKDLTLRATPEQVWHAVATAEGQASWSPNPYQDTSGLEVEQQRPTYFMVRTPVGPDGGFNAFEHLISPNPDGTTAFTFRHHGDLGESWEHPFDFEAMTSHGWDLYMHNLSAALEHFASRPAVFVTGQGPASSATPEAWERLTAALGLTAQPELGDQITLHAEGIGELVGVVDYVQPGISFLGLRTADGLFRFHDNSVMGMPQAFGHYLFDGSEREEAQRAWQGWLDAVLN